MPKYLCLQRPLPGGTNEPLSPAQMQELYATFRAWQEQFTAHAEWRGPAAGLAVLDGFAPPSWLADSYQWAAVHADLHRRCGNAEHAQVYLAIAYTTAPTAAVKLLLQQRFESTRSRC